MTTNRKYNFNTIPFLYEAVSHSLQDSPKSQYDAQITLEIARKNAKQHESMSDCQSIPDDFAKKIDGQVVVVGDEISKHALVVKDFTIYDSIFGNYKGVIEGQDSTQGVNEYRFNEGVFYIKRSNSRAGTYIEQSYVVPKQTTNLNLNPFELTMNNFPNTPYLASLWRYMHDGHLGGSLNLLEVSNQNFGKIVINCEVPNDSESFDTFSYKSDTNSFDPKSTNYIETIAKLCEVLDLDVYSTKEQLKLIFRNYKHIAKLKELLNS
jgi:hypothetical protein